MDKSKQKSNIEIDNHKNNINPVFLNTTKNKGGKIKILV